MNASNPAHAAPIKWAQRSASLYLTIPLSNMINSQFVFTERTMTFSGSSNGQDFCLSLEFYKEIDQDSCLWKVLPLSVQIKIMKREKGEGFWPRLLLDKAQERTNVTVDWERYVEEDDNPMDFCTRHLQDDIDGFAGDKAVERPSGGGRCPFGGDAGGFSDGEDFGFDDLGSDTE